MLHMTYGVVQKAYLSE